MRTLRQRLTITHTLVVLVAVGIVSTLTTALILHVFDRITRVQAEIQAVTIARQVGIIYQRRQNWDDVALILQQTIDPDTQRWVQIFDDQDHLVFDSAAPQASFRRRPGSGVQRPIVAGGEVIGTVVIGEQGNILTPVERRFLGAVYLISGAGSLLAIGMAFLVGAFLARQLTQPLRSLTHAAEQLASGGRRQPLPVCGDAELAELAHAFNTMADQIARQEDLRRQQVADIAHELRTPLTVLRLHIEALEDGVEAPTPQAFTSLSHEVALLNRLVDDLRLLSLADAGQLTLALEAIEPHDGLNRAATIALPRARAQGIDLDVDVHSDLPLIAADPQRLDQILSNLVANALRYTLRGGQITLRAVPSQSDPPQHSHDAPQTQQRAVRFEVSDTGPGIPAKDLPRIFDRFYRADHARSRETGGSGLGLAIVQRLVEAHGGQIGVASEPGTGATFFFTIPVTAHSPVPSPVR